MAVCDGQMKGQITKPTQFHVTKRTLHLILFHLDSLAPSVGYCKSDLRMSSIDFVLELSNGHKSRVKLEPNG